jgi:acyl transferase domain-containing protein/acyl carrier protein
MDDYLDRAIAVVGVGAIMPDAPDANAFWQNIKNGRYSISDVDPARWDPGLYYDPDPKAPEKSYSRIGGWVRDWEWNPRSWKLPVMPKVAEAMDDSQKWAVACTYQALTDYGYPGRPLDTDRVAVVLGNAMAGERHYQTALRINYPEIAEKLTETSTFHGLRLDDQGRLLAEFKEVFAKSYPEISEDSMPGELSNCIAGRVANLFSFRGPNYVIDAACASAMAATSSAVHGLVRGDYDAAITGGIDRNMGAATFVKFCKIGALSATGTRPYAEGADGFVMGEGAAVFVLKRLGDAVAAGDRIYAVLLGVAGSSDGKGKGITAPNPVGQKLAIERAWSNAGVVPQTASLVEGHGTSTRVGDVVEHESMAAVFGGSGVEQGSIALGSVKSNIGHLKAGAGAAGIFKVVMALHDKVLPPSLNFSRPNPDIDFSRSPFTVNTELREWEQPAAGIRRAGASAFGFGGTNFHAVLEEYSPERADGSRVFAVPEVKAKAATVAEPAVGLGPPPRGAALIGGATVAELDERLASLAAEAAEGRVPADGLPSSDFLTAPERVAIDFADAAELADKAGRARRALAAGPPAWRLLRARGVFRGQGPAPKVAFLYTGQGSQYPNMLRELAETDPIVAGIFDEADRVMAPLLEGNRLRDYLFIDPNDKAALASANKQLMRTEITQPAVLSVDHALTRLLSDRGIRPDFVMGHSLGEYGALVAAGALPFEDALEAVSARGREMANIDVEDHGLMAAVFAPIDEIEKVVEATEGNVVVANINSTSQAVIGGASAAVEQAETALHAAGHTVVRLPVSHAFHTSIVAPASEPLKTALSRLRLQPPGIPIVANVSGDFYPRGPDVVPEMIDILGRQVSSPVQFLRGLRTLYEHGARVFVEVGPKKALHGFVEEVLGDKPDVSALFTNHPKWADAVALNHALCGLYAAGLGGTPEPVPETAAFSQEDAFSGALSAVATGKRPENAAHAAVIPEHRYAELGRLVAEFLDRAAGDRSVEAESQRPIVVTGAGLGLPGTERFFDPSNLGRILQGEQFIQAIPAEMRDAILDQHITRLVKAEDGSGRFETIDDAADVIKLAARATAFDPTEEFGIDAGRLPALESTTCMAIAAGFDALHDAGIPLVQHYKTTSIGTRLPERWGLPDELRDDTGIIFASAFPGLDAFAGYAREYHEDRARREQLAALEAVRDTVVRWNGGRAQAGIIELDSRITALRAEIAAHPYVFDRRFLFRVLSMGHSQFAEIIGARGPNTQLNAACASTTQAFAVAEDWIRAGRCQRVVVVAADNVTSDNLLGWMGAGFLASGAAATDSEVEEAATPFDRRRHGMILGMGAAAIVVEDAASAEDRGIRPIADVLSSVTANSAFHGTRLDVSHITQVMETLVSQAEKRWGLDRAELARQMVFVSHETYTPARGGSAAAEVASLRTVFGPSAGEIVMANTKGFTGHPMAVGIEDIVAIKSLETGVVPPIPNFKEVDPDLGELNLSKGGSYPIRYALRLAAGFGSQISMTLLRWVPTPDGKHPEIEELGYPYRIDDAARWKSWLARVSGETEPSLEVVQHQLRVIESEQAEPVEAEPEEEPATVEAITPAAAPALSEDEVRQRVLAVVAEKTGYPEDMLDFELDLEADLGIDTVKQAELFATVREAYGIARDDNLKLRDFPTLDHVIRFVLERTAGPVPAPVSEPAAPVTSFAVSEEEVRQRVLAVVAEKTGYPEDMLDLELDLEADLGIDTVKQAELFATVREAYGIARDDNLKLRDFPTLDHVIRFVLDRAERPAGETPLTPARREAFEGLEACDAVPRRVPVPVLRPPLHFCKATGTTLQAGGRVVVMPDRGGAGDALVATLRDRSVDPLVLDPASGTEAVESQVQAWMANGEITGVYWLPALDTEAPLADLDFAAWKEGLQVRVKLLAAVMRVLYEQVSCPGTFLIAATRMGGYHGYDSAGATAPMGGAVTGFTKAYKRERPECLVKAVDVQSAAEPGQVADLLIEETLRDPGAVEIGRVDELRWSIGLQEEAAADGQPDLPLNPGTVFVVTGAAGSIVSAITSDLAAASGGTFHLLDLVPEPEPSNPDIDRFVSDPDGLKRDLFQRIKDRGERATPALVEREMARLERARAALDAITAVKQSGGQAYYHSVDLRDGEAVAGAIDAVRERNGRIDVLLHAAGLEVSRFLPDKTDQEYDLVFDVKSDGWFNLLSAIGDMPLGATVCFSSVAGRFGNGGQTDYSAANDLLCKTTSSFRTTRPATRGIVIDWTAWGGIGMATRGSIPRMMEMAGIDMLDPKAAIPWIRRELVAGGGRGEVVVGQRLGILTDEVDPDYGLGSTGSKALPKGPMLGDVVAMGVWLPLTVKIVIDPTVQRFLEDHRIDGIPVLPGVMGVEAFAEAASFALPGWRVQAIEDINFLAPFKFYRDEPREITIEATLTPDGSAEGQGVLATCRLLGSRQLPNQTEPQITTHFTGRVRLTPSTNQSAAPAARLAPSVTSGAGAGRESIYRIYFHGPAYQVLERSWHEGDRQIGLMAETLPPNHHPANLPLATAPRLLELCFQTAGVWELGSSGRLALPQHVARVELLGSEETLSGRAYAVVTPRDGGLTFDADVIDSAGSLHLRMEGYQTIALRSRVDAELLRPLQPTTLPTGR